PGGGPGKAHGIEERGIDREITAGRLHEDAISSHDRLRVADRLKAARGRDRTPGIRNRVVDRYFGRILPGTAGAVVFPAGHDDAPVRQYRRREETRGVPARHRRKLRPGAVDVIASIAR